MAQYLISQEVLLDTAIVIFAALACAAVRYPWKIREVARAMARPLLVLGLAASLLAYPAWMLIAGPQHATTSANPIVNPFHNDLLSFLVPGPLQRASFGMRSLGNYLMMGPNPHHTLFHTASNPVEFDAFIGPAILTLVGYLGWRSRHRPRMQLTIAMFVVSAVLSLGPYLVVDAQSTHIPLPFLLLRSHPPR